jgi:hypothetical protein
MAQLDERFLTVHPRTRQWWQQREQCLRCAHCVREPQGCRDKTNLGMRCGLASRGLHSDACISARDEGAACGPDAKLFKEAGR